jgi:hypothetical protein
VTEEDLNYLIRIARTRAEMSNPLAFIILKRSADHTAVTIVVTSIQRNMLSPSSESIIEMEAVSSSETVVKENVKLSLCLIN